jgi:hypothetical protein
MVAPHGTYGKPAGRTAESRRPARLSPLARPVPGVSKVQS